MIKTDGKMGVIRFKNGRLKLVRGVKLGYRGAVSFIFLICLTFNGLHFLATIF
jgi:hypothetical protein